MLSHQGHKDVQQDLVGPKLCDLDLCYLPDLITLSCLLPFPASPILPFLATPLERHCSGSRPLLLLFSFSWAVGSKLSVSFRYYDFNYSPGIVPVSKITFLQYTLVKRLKIQYFKIYLLCSIGINLESSLN